jgi:hypothetical protein
MPRSARGFILIPSLVALVAYVFSLGPIPQPDAYHRFADARTLLGIPNALNVLSNLPFAVVGPIGLAAVMTAARSSPELFRDPWERWPWAVLFAGITLTAFGSAWYHLAPANARLVWDRIPMTFGFMGLVSALIAERVSVRLGRALLGPLLLLGVGSVIYWYWSETIGEGDLRPYVVVQLGSLLAAFLMAVLYPARHSGTGYILLALGIYAGAKGLEDADARIFAMGELVSGHTLKHLAAAAAVACIVMMIRARTARAPTALPAPPASGSAQPARSSGR